MSEEIDLFDVDEETGEVTRAETPEPDANRAKNIRGSVSLIKAYMQCPAQAYGRITRQKQEKGVALINGIAVHEAIEKYIKDDVDPQAYYLKTLALEAELNKVALNTKDGDEAKRTGTECVGAAVGILDYEGTTGTTLKERMDKDLVECSFNVERGGRKYIGKIDFAVFAQDGTRYFLGDWKTGRNSPDQFELDNDLQFSMYPYATAHDPALKTFGKWPEYGVYMHLRGQSTEFDKSGKRVPKNRSKERLKYDFPTKRTPEKVEADFVNTIEPVMSLMEEGHFPRYQGKSCSYCSFFDKEKQRCGVEIPTDSLVPNEEKERGLFDSPTP